MRVIDRLGNNINASFRLATVKNKGLMTVDFGPVPLVVANLPAFLEQATDEQLKSHSWQEQTCRFIMGNFIIHNTVSKSTFWLTEVNLRSTGPSIRIHGLTANTIGVMDPYHFIKGIINKDYVLYEFLDSSTP